VVSNLIELISERIDKAGRILVISHIRPDGDAVGSLLGLGLSLMERGKQVEMVISDGVPQSLRHLPGSEMVHNSPSGYFDLAITLDCSDLSRTGRALQDYGFPDINIDHHATNQNFAHLNLIDADAVSTTQILAMHLEAWRLPLIKPVADALLTGLITDTIGFRTANVTPDVMRVVARLMEAGSNLSDLYHEGLVNRSYEAVRFWGAGLSKLEREGSVIWTTLTITDRQAAGYGGRDDADLINLLTTINDVSICLVFVEQPNGKVKVSWRCVPGLNISKVAMEFGGGGHPVASGAEIQGALEEVRAAVLEKTIQMVKNNHQYQMDGLRNE
jgi:bifunctional oligoribonuclease and PAP phosphatase NrnA